MPQTLGQCMKILTLELVIRAQTYVNGDRLVVRNPLLEPFALPVLD